MQKRRRRVGESMGQWNGDVGRLCPMRMEIDICWDKVSLFNSFPNFHFNSWPQLLFLPFYTCP